MQNKFIRPAGKPSSPSDAKAAPQAPQRRMVQEVVSTQSFAFPDRTGQGNQAPEAAAPVAQPTPTATPAPKSYAEVDPDFTSIDLPSIFQFYDFKSLALRTLKGSHQAKFSRARKEGRLRYVVEAISATLEPNRSAFDLTPGDFYFLMFWQRVNSFTKNPMVVTAYCDNEKHNHSVYVGDEVDDPDNPGEKKIVKMDESTLQNESFLKSTTLDSVYAEKVDTSHLAITAKYLLGVETMRDVVEATEFIQDAKEPLTEEDMFLIKYAPFLKTGPNQENIVAKMKVVADMDADDLAELDEYMHLVTRYGVNEFANIRCKGCGASIRVNIPFDALTFLPGGR